MDYKQLLNDIKKIAITQGEILEKAFKSDETVESLLKDNENWTDIDVVTKLDSEIEKVFYDELSRKYPELGFVLEENTELNDETKDFVCFIDPIDGTKYFAKNVPLFSISAGVMYKGEPVLGVAYDPIAEQMYAGAEGITTTLNGLPVSVSKTAKLEDAFISLDVATHKENWEAEKDWMNQKIIEFNLNAKRIRLFGQGVLSCAWVASGGLDAFVSVWGHGSKPFDIAAGKALIKYAGGEVLDIKVPGFDNPRFVGGNKELVKEIESLLMK